MVILMSASRNLLLTSLTAYYNIRPECRHVISSIIKGDSKLSLRILDWFVTHFARMNSVIYYIDTTNKSKNVLHDYPDTGGGAHIKKFNLYYEYRKQLQSYTKMFFDPFRRHERISFVIDENPLMLIETTVGQLNFFRWATENLVIDYVMEHLNEIEVHMATHQKNIIKKDVPNTVSYGVCHVLFN